MTGPFDRVISSQTWRTLRGTVNLDAGTHNVRVELLAGEADLEFIEEIDAAITTFGVDEPVRLLNRRRRLRLVIEAEMDGMVVTFDPKTQPGNG